jgi:hypothetical protein
VVVLIHAFFDNFYWVTWYVEKLQFYNFFPRRIISIVGAVACFPTFVLSFFAISVNQDRRLEVPSDIELKSEGSRSCDSDDLDEGTPEFEPKKITKDGYFFLTTSKSHYTVVFLSCGNYFFNFFLGHFFVRDFSFHFL